VRWKLLAQQEFGNSELEPLQKDGVLIILEAVTIHCHSGLYSWTPYINEWERGLWAQAELCLGPPV
jgi:hypothetical protein